MKQTVREMKRYLMDLSASHRSLGVLLEAEGLRKSWSLPIRETVREALFRAFFWDDRATQISSFDVGTMLHITGRLQSREYRKKMPDDTQEIKVTYELSVCRYGILAPPKNRTERVG